MIFRNYKRYLFSRRTLVALLLLIPGIISFIISYGDKAEWIAMSYGNEPDMNYDALAHLIETYTGFEFMLDYWFIQDFFFIFLIGLAVWVGTFLSSELQQQKESGTGNLSLTRTSYKTYLRMILLSQSFYIGTIVTGLHMVLFSAALIIGGTGNGEFVCGIAGAEFNALQATGLILLQTLLISLYAVLINSIAALLNCWISNKYILQSAALVFFSLIPMVATSILTEYPPSLLTQTIMAFLPWEILRVLEWAFQNTTQMAYRAIPMITYLILTVILYHVNIRKYAEDYL